MGNEVGRLHVVDVEAGAAVPPEGHFLYARDTDKTYSSDGTTLTLFSTGGGAYTDEQAQDAVGAMVDTTLVYTDSTPLLSRAALTGDVTASAGSNATTIANDAVTYAKIQNVTDARLLGRSAGSSGDVQEITVGTNLSLASGNLKCTAYTLGILDVKPGSADTPDDDFSSGSLDAKWTAVYGSSGTVDLFATGTTIATYDLASRPGWLMVQVGKNLGNKVYLRQDYTLPDGNSIVAAFACNSGFNTVAGAVNNSLAYGIAVNSTDSDISSGTYTYIYADTQNLTGPRPIIVSSVGSNYTGPDNCMGLGNVIYFRISRVGTNYSHFMSTNGGVTWCFLGTKALGGAADNVWIFWSLDTTITGPAPISGCKFFRLGTNNIDPW